MVEPTTYSSPSCIGFFSFNSFGLSPMHACSEVSATEYIDYIYVKYIYKWLWKLL